jgi:hypothetical protein
MHQKGEMTGVPGGKLKNASVLEKNIVKLSEKGYKPRPVDVLINDSG